MGLWDRLREGGDARNVANVQKLVEYASGKLVLIRETFRDYTLHDRTHAENVVALVEKLLGPDLDRISPLDSAMLILAAYFHDIGMVYDEHELVELLEEEDFREFLDQNSSAYVQVRQATEVPPEVVIQYCRARHAERVSEHLYRLEPETLSWDGVGIAEGLAILCQSHNESVSHLRSEKFSTTFLGGCDLRMCAILLRLADILDFDQSRSPVAVYEHLRLHHATQGPRAISEMEWSKHQAARGFRFPDRRTPNYPITFLASPRRPAVEHAIRKFLDVVEEELRGARILLDYCDERWQSLHLPGTVDRSGIVSSGYRYGEYLFSLDRQAVLRLFMGDRLYNNPYVFIRELLQNAIDACRLSVYLHDADPAGMEIRVSAWEDDAGYYWLRVDDNGVGMDQGIVERYFLGVGRSYYTSDELHAEILRKNKPKHKFLAVSRFGVGVLSSFIVGDKIEVSTRRRLPSGKLVPPLRLSLDGLDDFFVLQEPPMVPDPFPSRSAREAGYRKAAGTSIAVRIDPTKADVSLDGLLRNVEEALFFPPVRIIVNDVEQPDWHQSRLDAPLLSHVVVRESPEISVEHRFGRGIDGTLDISAITEIRLHAIPLDLTRHSPSPKVRGQLVAIAGEVRSSASLLGALPEDFRRRLPESVSEKLANSVASCSIALSSGAEPKFEIRLTVAVDALLATYEWLLHDAQTSGKGDGNSDSKDLADDTFQRIFGYDSRHLRGRRESLSARLWTLERVIPFNQWLSGINVRRVSQTNWLGHNGIAVPAAPGTQTESLSSGTRCFMTGYISLFDELRPDLSVSRDSVLGVSFEIQSAVQLAIRRAGSVHSGDLAPHLVEIVEESSLFPHIPSVPLTRAQIEADPLLSEWRNEQLIETADGRRSISELWEMADADRATLHLSMFPWRVPSRSFHRMMASALADVSLDLGASAEESDVPHHLRRIFIKAEVLSAAKPARPPGLGALPPLAALPYLPPSPDVLVAVHSVPNLAHPVIAWFAEHADTLRADYPALFAQIQRGLHRPSSSFEGTDRTAAAALLNTALDRIRRAVPLSTPALAVEIVADADGTLRSRS